MTMRATGYEPLKTLKPVAPSLWLIDGPAIRFYGLPFSTRATIVRLRGGALWVHSPTALIKGLVEELNALGPVAHLIAPNWIHYAHVASWQEEWPVAKVWVAPGVAERARRKGAHFRIDHELRSDGPEPPWDGEIDQMIVPGSRVHREAVFLHIASRTLILTDLIENFEPTKLPCWMAALTRVAGFADPDGRMPPDMRLTFDKVALKGAVERMLAWAPERVVLAHGRWYDRDGTAELRRAFRSLLR